jgi:VWFA-related protein
MIHILRVGLAMFALAAVPSVAQQIQPPSFPTKVELTTVDVVVVDKEGKPVVGLTRDDFALFEDRKAQEIISFEAFSNTGAAPIATTTALGNDGSEPRQEETGPPSPPLSRPIRGSAFLLLVDDLHISPESDVFARRAVASFLERSVWDGDEVILVTSSRAVGWRGRLPEARESLLQVLPSIHGRDASRREPQPMSEYRAFEMLRGGPSFVKMPGDDQWARAQGIDGLRRERMDRILGLLRMASDAWSASRARKSVLFLSEGFIQDDSEELRRMTAVAQQANAAVYFIDVRGLVPPRGFSADNSGPDEPLEERQRDAAGSRDLAEQTGGFSIRSNGLAEGLQRVAAESRTYYLLGFYPPAGKRASAWRKLRVEVKRHGLTVRARTGYRLVASTVRSPATSPVAAAP